LLRTGILTFPAAILVLVVVFPNWESIAPDLLIYGSNLY